MPSKFIIFAPNYDPNSGGSIVLHKLCHLINASGRQAFLFPSFENRLINPLNFRETLKHLNDDLWRLSLDWRISSTPLFSSAPPQDSLITKLKKIKRILLGQIEQPLLAPEERYVIKTNPEFNTPTLSFENVGKISEDDDTIVIYPEIVNGNPLKAKNVVRWLLHSPGFHHGMIAYSPGELYFRFTVETPAFQFPGSVTSEQFLTVVHFPLNLYYPPEPNATRSGTAYCLRKGAHKPIVHDLENSICIDGKSHEEIAEIFRMVKQFICYDTRTAYYNFAPLCGCETIVIPDEGVSIDEWLPSPNSRIGITYGMENAGKVLADPQDVLRFLQSEEKATQQRVISCIEEMEPFFAK